LSHVRTIDFTWRLPQPAPRFDRFGQRVPDGCAAEENVSDGGIQLSRIAELLDRKRSDVAQRKASHPLSISSVPADDRRISGNPNRFWIFSEIKRSSLSAGKIRPALDLQGLVRSYQDAGAAVISILTE